MYEGCRKCLLVIRSLLVTALTWGSIGYFVYALVSPPAHRLSVPLSLFLTLVGLALYCLEIRTRQVWFAARRCCQEPFSEYAQQLVDAAPLMDLEAPGCEPAPYSLAQWQDESSWVDFGMNVKRGTVLASFPLEFVPGDHAEAAALDFAMSQYAAEAQRGDREAEKLKPQVDLRLRLRWPDGAESEAPDAELLSSGPTGAEWLCPGLLLLACLSLVGLLVDVALLCVAEPVEWPVRKRFFTLPGARVGALSFTCSTDGSVSVTGELEELRAANRFWIRNDADWKLVEEEVAQLAPLLQHLRRLRRLGQALAAATVVATGAGVAMAGEAAARTEACGPLLAGAAAALCFWAMAGVVDCIAQRRMAACSERIGKLLPGGAMVTATWNSQSCAPCGPDLSIGVEQLKPAGAGKELPVFKSSAASGSASSSMRPAASASASVAGRPQAAGGSKQGLR